MTATEANRRQAEIWDKYVDHENDLMRPVSGDKACQYFKENVKTFSEEYTGENDVWSEKQTPLTKQDIAEYITHMRGSIGVTQSVLANMLGIRPSLIVRYECGQTKPKNAEDFCKKVQTVVKAEIQRKRMT